MVVRPLTVDRKAARALADELRDLRKLGTDRRAASLVLFRKALERLAAPRSITSATSLRRKPS